jgi:hypothetical protein
VAVVANFDHYRPVDAVVVAERDFAEAEDYGNMTILDYQGLFDVDVAFVKAIETLSYAAADVVASAGNSPGAYSLFVFPGSW